MSVQMPYTLDENEQAVLDALREEGRANPMLLREKTDLRKQYVNDALTQLQKADRVRKVSRGLYEYAGDDEAESADGDVDAEAAREAYQQLLDARERVDQEAIDEALDELADALGVEEDDG